MCLLGRCMEAPRKTPVSLLVQEAVSTLLEQLGALSHLKLCPAGFGPIPELVCKCNPAPVLRCLSENTQVLEKDDNTEPRGRGGGEAGGGE